MKYCILTKAKMSDKWQIVKKITFETIFDVKLETVGDNVNEALLFDSQEKICFLLDAIQALSPETIVAPMVIEDAKTTENKDSNKYAE